RGRRFGILAGLPQLADLLVGDVKLGLPGPRQSLLAGAGGIFFFAIALPGSPVLRPDRIGRKQDHYRRKRQIGGGFRVLTPQHLVLTQMPGPNLPLICGFVRASPWLSAARWLSG